MSERKKVDYEALARERNIRGILQDRAKAEKPYVKKSNVLLIEGALEKTKIIHDLIELNKTPVRSEDIARYMRNPLNYEIDERTVRAYIKKLVDDGCPVISTGEGYRIAEYQDEIMPFLLALHKRVCTLQRTLHRQIKNAARLPLRNTRDQD
jgi:hypothetical protein